MGSGSPPPHTLINNRLRNLQCKTAVRHGGHAATMLQVTEAEGLSLLPCRADTPPDSSGYADGREGAQELALAWLLAWALA